MGMKNAFHNRATGFYLGLAGGVLAIIALVCYLLHGGVSGVLNTLVLLPLIGVALVQIAGLLIDNDLLVIGAPVLCAVSLCAFLVDAVNILVGYFFNLTMFGDVSQIGFVAQVSIFAGAAVVVLLAGAFLKKNQAE